MNEPADHRWANPTPTPRSSSANERVTALLEVVLCSGLPTQLALSAVLVLAGIVPEDGQLSVLYVVTLSLLDTMLVTGLILLFLRAHREDPRRIFIGSRPVSGEALAGLPLALMALGLAAVTLTALHEFAPWLRTYEQNPLQELIQTPMDLVLFGIVVVIAGGVREEIQRAFLLTRFEGHLGGAQVGVVVTSLAFGAGHYLQGADAAVATALLGAFWALIYIRRRSVIAPVVSHACFNLLQLVQLAVIAG